MFRFSKDPGIFKVVVFQIDPWNMTAILKCCNSLSSFMYFTYHTLNKIQNAQLEMG